MQANIEVLLLLSFAIYLANGQELFMNPSLESSFSGNWQCNSCTLTASIEAYQGSKSGRITNRQQHWAGIGQKINVQAGKSYIFSAVIKVLGSSPLTKRHKVDFLIAIDYSSRGPRQYFWIYRTTYTSRAIGWSKVGADFVLPSDKGSIKWAFFYVQFEDDSLDYLFDDASLKEIPANPNWEAEANSRIRQLRTRPLKIRLKVDASYIPSLLRVKVQQIRHDFAFGSAVAANPITATTQPYLKYQHVFYELFEWAVIENALKWYNMEWTQGNINYDRADKAITALLQHGIPVRGHNVLWGVKDFVPDWVQPLSGAQLRAAVNTRVTGVVGRYKGRLVHWDVNNEQLHGWFFEDNTGDPWYTEKIHTRVQQVDPKAKLFFNEYNVVNGQESTFAYYNQIKHALDNDIPVYGIGVQIHVGPTLDSYERLKTRLDLLATLGIPIWITELSVQHPNVNTRADYYESLLRLFFSHPAVEGVLLWGFWDGSHWRPQAVLAEGNDVTLNAAGIRYKQLVKETWSTTKTFTPSQSQQTLSVQAYHGTYRITITYRGSEILQTIITLNKGNTNYYVDLQIPGPCGSPQLLQNPGFEGSLSGNWYCGTWCTLTRSSTSYEGSWAGKVTDRTDYWAGPRQDVSLQPSHTYRFSVYVKMLNKVPGKTFHTLKLTLAIDDSQWFTFAWNPRMTKVQGWTLIEGQVTTPSSSFSSSFVYLEFMDKEIDFLLDKTCLTTGCSPQLLKNPGFEGEINGNWYCGSFCRLQRPTNPYEGARAAKVTQRVAYWAGPRQKVNLQPAMTYRFSAYIKMLNQIPGKQFYTAKLTLAIDDSQYFGFAQDTQMTKAGGWNLLQGQVTMPSSTFSSSVVYIEFTDKEINFLVDKTCLTPV